jgi:hypothetical protein
MRGQVITGFMAYSGAPLNLDWANKRRNVPKVDGKAFVGVELFCKASIRDVLM